jgi:hypothetical protein
MTELLGIPIVNATLEAWAKVFVFELEPLFLEHSTPDLFNDAPLIYSRPDFDFWLGSMPLEYKDAYRFWNVKLDAVLLLTSQEFEVLPRNVQKKLNAAQVNAKRGLVFPLADAKRFGVDATFLKRDGFKNDFILRFDAWWSLTRAQRFVWLKAFVSEGLEMNRIYDHPLMRFFPCSGANCFATALAALEIHQARAVNIARLWLSEAVFQSALEARGYRTKAFAVYDFQRHTVLTWHNSSGKTVHAATCLGNDLWLNKDSQAWYSPVQVLTTQVLLAHWSEPDLNIWIWTKS